MVSSILDWLEKHQGTGTWMQVFGAMVAILAGAWYVRYQHRLVETAAQAKEQAREAEICAYLIGRFSVVHKLLVEYRADFIDPIRANPVRHLVCQGTAEVSARYAMPPLELYSFLFGSRDSALAADLSKLSDQIHVVAQGIDWHSRYCHESLHPAIGRLVDEHGVIPPPNDLPNLLSPSVESEARRVFDEMCGRVDGTLNKLSTQRERLLDRLHSLYPAVSYRALWPAVNPPPAGTGNAHVYADQPAAAAAHHTPPS